MNLSGDDFDDMDAQGVRPGAGGTSGGLGGAGDDVTRFLTELRALGDGPPPEPSAELAALLGGATPLLSRRALVRTALRTAAVAAILLGVLVVAAANHSLPAPAQRVVSNVVNVLTPFHIGRDHPQPVIEPPRPGDKPRPVVPSHRPTPTHPATPPHRTTPPAGGGDDGRGAGGGDDGSPSRSRSTGDGGSDDGAGSRDGGGTDDGGSDGGHSAGPSASPTSTRNDDGGHSGGSDDGPGDD